MTTIDDVAQILLVMLAVYYWLQARKAKQR